MQIQQRRARCLSASGIRRTLLAGVGLLFAMFGKAALANGFDIFSEQGKLTDQLIIAAGNVTVMPRLSATVERGQSYGLPRSVAFQIAQFCFVSSEDLDGKAGLLLVDRFSKVSVAVISTAISSIKLSSSGVVMVDCAGIRQQDMSQLQSQLDSQRKQMEALMELLKKQQQQAKPKR